MMMMMMMMMMNDDDDDDCIADDETKFCDNNCRRNANRRRRRRRRRRSTITTVPPSSSCTSITDDGDGHRLYNKASSSSIFRRSHSIFDFDEGLIFCRERSDEHNNDVLVVANRYNNRRHSNLDRKRMRTMMMDVGRRTTTKNKMRLRRPLGGISTALSKTTSASFSVTVICFFIVLLFLSLSSVVAAASSPPSSDANNNNINPYRVLGLDPPTSARFSSSSSQEAVVMTDTDIKKAFRKLALQYHPDKYHQLPQKERLHAEQKFKQIQHAYSQIKDEESRRQYDFESRYYGGGSGSRDTGGSSTSTRWNPASSSSPYGNDPISEAFFRAFEQGGFGGGRGFYNSRGRSFTGFRMPFPTASSSSDDGQFFSRTASPMMPAELSFKSIYVQKVVMPLQDLYCGIPKYKFDLHDNIWTRYRAAFRGKIWLLSFYQGMMYSLPVLRIAGSKIFALIVGLFIFHGTLPRPDPSRKYESTIRKGLKGGSSIKFTSTAFGIPDVVFEIVEEHHPNLKRVDNDLHTTVWIYEDEARTGCTKQLPSISDEYDHVSVVIPPNVYKYEPLLQSSSSSSSKKGKKENNKTKKKTIRVAGVGWPILNGTHRDGSVGRHKYRYGDMIVTVQVRKGNSPYEKQQNKTSKSSKNNKRKKQKKQKSNTSSNKSTTAWRWSGHVIDRIRTSLGLRR